MSDTPDSVVRTYIRTHRAAFPDDLAGRPRVPSVSAQPDHDADVRRGTGRLVGKLKETGFPVAEIRRTPRGPAVSAERPSAGPDTPTGPVHGHDGIRRAAHEDGPHTDHVSVPSGGRHAASEKAGPVPPLEDVLLEDLLLNEGETTARPGGDLATAPR
ncbi:hypothetical protein ACWGDX_28080 [Streptomyces sp. NPDC055025]